MAKLYIGVDQGKGGGFAILSKEGEVVNIMATPLAGKELDCDAIIDFLVKYGVDSLLNNVVACIEKVGAMPHQGVTSMYTFGYVTGIVHGIIASFGIPRYVVTPNEWKKVVLAGLGKDKDAALAYCKRAFPGVCLLATERSKVPHTGIIDALCIAQYARMKY